MSEGHFVYLHGFASSANAYKGTSLKAAFNDRGLDFGTPDLNVPSFETMTYSSILEALDAMYLSSPTPWFVVGSSMGGYLAARWAELHPKRVGAMVLLCPAFDLPGRWEKDHGSELMDAWKRGGHLPIPDATGEHKNLDWGFIEDARRHPTRPYSPIPTLIIHGRQDETIPIESSRRYVQQHSDIHLLEVDDDHGLAASIELITSEVFGFFELNGAISM